MSQHATALLGLHHEAEQKQRKPSFDDVVVGAALLGAPMLEHIRRCPARAGASKQTFE